MRIGYIGQGMNEPKNLCAAKSRNVESPCGRLTNLEMHRTALEPQDPARTVGLSGGGCWRPAGLNFGSRAHCLRGYDRHHCCCWPVSSSASSFPTMSSAGTASTAVPMVTLYLSIFLIVFGCSSEIRLALFRGKATRPVVWLRGPRA